VVPNNAICTFPLMGEVVRGDGNNKAPNGRRIG
jgi:hypothetical protein